MNLFRDRRNLSYYPSGCDTLPAHSCAPCDKAELGRVRGVAIIKSGFTFTDPTSATEWDTAIAAGNIIIIPQTNGTFDGGKPKEGPGFGNTPNTYLGSEFTLKYKDPDYIKNILFYNAIRNTRDYVMAYLTETQVHIVQYPVSFRPSAPVAEGLDSQVVWEVECKWIGHDSPIPYLAPAGVFVCYIP